MMSYLPKPAGLAQQNLTLHLFTVLRACSLLSRIILLRIYVHDIADANSEDRILN